MHYKPGINNNNIGNKVKRRKFFGTFGKGVAGLFLLKLLPVKILFGASEENSNTKVKKTIKVTVHPLAVKYGTRKVNVNE